MEDAAVASLGRLQALAAELGPSAAQEQLQQLRSACAAALSAAGPSPGAAQQKALWSAAASLWNASIDLASGEEEAAAGAAAPAAAPAARTRVVAALRQAACDLCSPVALGSLLPPDQANLVRFHFKAGQAWAELEELEAAEAALSRADEAAQVLAPLCFERRSRGPQHQDAAALCFQIQLDRLGVALRLGQEMLVSGLLSQVCAFAADERLPGSDGLAFRLALIRALRGHGQALAEAGTPAAAVPLLSAAYETLSQLDLGTDDPGELGTMAAEAKAMGAQVLTLLAWCYVESGEGEPALSCLQALQQVAEGPAADHYSHCFLTLRALLQLGRSGEAETQLMNLVSHEEASSEACLAGLKASLASPGGAQLARSALSVVLERFVEEPAVAVELVRAALAQAAAAAASAGRTDGAAPMTEDGAGAGGSAGANGGMAAAEAAEAVALEVAADDRLLESLGEEPALRRQLAGLLYNHALLCLHGGRAGDAGLAFFSAALPLLGHNSQGVSEGPHPADCRRAQALCAMAAGQHDRALELLDAADAALPGTLPTAMLRLSVHLAAGSSAGAVAAVAALADCPGAGADPLRVACCECLDAGQQGAARQALELLLLRCTEARVAAAESGGSGSSPAAEGLCAPGYEATVFQNLIKLVLDSAPPKTAQPSNEEAEPAGAPAPSCSLAHAAHSSELARLFDALVSRMRAVGADAFFIQQDGRHAQLEWLALQAWNSGQAAGAAGELQQAAVLMAACGELYAALPAPSQAALHKRKLAFLMAAASACEVHETAAADAGTQQPAADSGVRPASSAALNLARSCLAQSRAAGAALAAAQAVEGQQAGADPKSDVFTLLLNFWLACLSQDTPAQLESLERCKALPAFGAEHFAMAAALARGCLGGGADAGSNGRAGAMEVCRAAEGARLQRLTQQAPMDYAAVASTLRVLLELSPSDADRLQLLGEAAGLLGAAPPGVYPAQELRWLVTTSWNRGAVHARFGRAAEAAAYQRWAEAALRHDAGLAAQYQELMAAELEQMGQAGQKSEAAAGAEALAL